MTTTDEITQLREDLAEARTWARHGYEIGQRSTLWSDHGVAPAWLTEGWPPHFDTDPVTKTLCQIDELLLHYRSALDTAINKLRAGRDA